MKKYSKLISLINEYIENIKGHRELIPVLNKEDTPFVAEFELDNGSKINIVCDEINYILKYNKWWVLNKHITIYKVYSTTNENTNEQIINKFHKKEFHINNLWYFFADTQNKKKAAINAFFDIIRYSSIVS